MWIYLFTGDNCSTTDHTYNTWNGKATQLHGFVIDQSAVLLSPPGDCGTYLFSKGKQDAWCN